MENEISYKLFGASWNIVPLLRPKAVISEAAVRLSSEKLKLYSSSCPKVKKLKLGFDFKFNYIEVPNNDVLVEYVRESIADLGYTQVQGLRLNFIRRTQFIEEHVDSAFEGHDTLIIELSEDKRLLVEGKRLEFDTGTISGILLNEGTRHSVIPGDRPRFSLVCWIK